MYGSKVLGVAPLSTKDYFGGLGWGDWGMGDGGWWIGDWGWGMGEVEAFVECICGCQLTYSYICMQGPLIFDS